VDDGYDFIYLYDGTGTQIGKYTGKELAGQTITITGDTIKIKLVSDDAITGYGFKVDKIARSGETIGLKSIALSETALQLRNGEQKKLQVIYNPTDTTVDKTVTWSSSDATVAVVETDGTVTAKGAGTAVITAEVAEKKAECRVTVEETFVTLDYQDDTGKTEKISVVYGEHLSVLEDKTPTRESYQFVGWYTQPKGQGEKVTRDTILTDQWTLYACWMQVTEALWVEPVGDQVYTGKAIKPSVTVYDGDVLLQEKKDYTVSYKNNVSANDASDANTAPSVIVTGKGNYVGKSVVTFKILAQDINGTEFTIDDMALAYNAKKTQKPVPTVLWNGKKLKNGKDFKVTYPNESDGTVDAYKASGTYDIKVTGIGNFTGERTIALTITQNNLISKAKVAKISNQVYQKGNPIEPEVTVKMGKDTLTEGVHYEVSYENNCEVGTATAVIIGKGNYSGVKRVTFKITGTSIAKAKVEGLTDKVYNGNSQTQQLKLSLTDKTGAVTALAEGQDYTVSYSNNVNAGTATLIIQGIGQYTGNIKKKFKITTCDLKVNQSAAEFHLGGQSVEGSVLDSAKITAKYTKGGSRPEVEIYMDTVGKWLTEGKDFTVTYANNKAVTESGTRKLPTITIKGKGNYSGTVTTTFSITAKALDDTDSPVTVTAVDKAAVNKAGGYIVKPILTDADGKTLKEGVDYTVVGYTAVYPNGETEALTNKSIVTEVGTKIMITINGKGAYGQTGSASGEEDSSVLVATYRITAKSLKGVKNNLSSKTYTGSAVELTEEDFAAGQDGNGNILSRLTIKDGKTTKNLIFGKDFEIVEGSYKNNVKKGTASVTIKGCGEYGGTAVIKFKIVGKELSIQNWF
jgi:uncharacterized repeat protein (TIGR02543 family)